MSLEVDEAVHDVSCPHCGVVSRSGMVRCRACGKLLHGDSSALVAVIAESSPAVAAPASDKTTGVSGLGTSEQEVKVPVAVASTVAVVVPPTTRTASVSAAASVRSSGHAVPAKSGRWWIRLAAAVGVVVVGSVAGIAIAWREPVDVRAARWVVQHGGVVRIEFIPQPQKGVVAATAIAEADGDTEPLVAQEVLPETHTVSAGTKLPSAPFRVVEVNLEDQVIDKSGLPVLAKLSSLRLLDLSRTGVGDDVLATVGRMTNLKTLRLRGAKISSKGFQQLAGLQELDDLTISGCVKLDDDVRETLLGFPNLRIVLLNGTGVGDVLLDALSKSGPKLQRVGIERTQVTQAGVERFRKARSKCRVDEDFAPKAKKPSKTKK